MPARRIAVHELYLSDDRVTGVRDQALRADVETGKLARARDPIRNRGVHATERHAVYDELDVLVEQLAQGVEVAIVVRPGIAGGERAEIHAHELPPASAPSSTAAKETWH